MGQCILMDEHDFNRRAGFTKADDRLPEMFADVFPPHNTTWDFDEEELQQAKQFEKPQLQEAPLSSAAA
jgi:aldehyde:ferredoxin oxidoreductase